MSSEAEAAWKSELAAALTTALGALAQEDRGVGDGCCEECRRWRAWAERLSCPPEYALGDRRADWIHRAENEMLRTTIGIAVRRGWKLW